MPRRRAPNRPGRPQTAPWAQPRRHVPTSARPLSGPDADLPEPGGGAEGFARRDRGGAEQHLAVREHPEGAVPGLRLLLCEHGALLQGAACCARGVEPGRGGAAVCPGVGACEDLRGPRPVPSPLLLPQKDKEPVPWEFPSSLAFSRMNAFFRRVRTVEVKSARCRRPHSAAVPSPLAPPPTPRTWGTCVIGPLPSAPRAVSQEQTGPVLAASPYAMPLAYEQAGRSEGSGGTLQSGGGGRGSGRRPRRRAGRLCSWFCGLCWRLFDLVHMLLAPLKGGGGGTAGR